MKTISTITSRGRMEYRLSCPECGWSGTFTDYDEAVRETLYHSHAYCTECLKEQRRTIVAAGELCTKHAGDIPDVFLEYE